MTLGGPLFNLRYLWLIWREMGFRAMVRGPLRRWLRHKRERTKR